MCKSVLLPTPDSPTIANRSAVFNSKLSSRSTTISFPPSLYVLWMSRAERRLFITDDLDRIEFRGLACGIKASEQTNHKRCHGNDHKIAEINAHRNGGDQEYIFRKFEAVLSNQCADEKTQEEA